MAKIKRLPKKFNEGGLFPLGSCPIKQVNHFFKHEVPANHSIRTHSSPGHLFHLVLEGAYDLQISEHQYHARTGDVIYYYEGESVYWMRNEQPVSFYTLGVDAPDYAPLARNKRVFASNRFIRSAFDGLSKHWMDEEQYLNPIPYFSHSLDIMNRLLMRKKDGGPFFANNIWRQIEATFRRQGRYRTSLKSLEEEFSYSQATISRACHQLYQLPPLKRLAQIRMEAARGFLRHSVLSITEISQRLGYTRVHEFSREFQSHHELSPRSFRDNYGL